MGCVCSDGERRRENVPCTCMYINTSPKKPNPRVRRVLRNVTVYMYNTRVQECNDPCFSPHCCTRRRRRRAPMTTRTLLYTCTVYPSVRPFVRLSSHVPFRRRRRRRRLQLRCYENAARAFSFIRSRPPPPPPRTFFCMHIQSISVGFLSVIFYSKIILIFRLVPFNRWTAVYHYT